MDEVRNEVVEESMKANIELKRSGQHKDLQTFLEHYGEGANSSDERNVHSAKTVTTGPILDKRGP